MTKKRIIAKAFALLLAVAVPAMFMSCEKEEPNKPNTENNGGENNGGNQGFHYTNQMTVDGNNYGFTKGTANVNAGAYTFVKVTNDDETIRAYMWFRTGATINGDFTDGNMMDLQDDECFTNIFFPGIGDYPETLHDVELTVVNDGDNFGFRCTGTCNLGQVSWNYYGPVENL